MISEQAAKTYKENDPDFIKDLRESQESVRVAAKWLSDQGYPVTIKPTVERPDETVMDEYSDDGDLEVGHRVEVKRRVGLTFSSKADFPYDTIIVDACHCYDKAHPKPYAYMIFNTDMSAMFVINCKNTHEKWKKLEKYDTFKKRKRWFYECPISLAEFVKMPQQKTSTTA